MKRLLEEDVGNDVPFPKQEPPYLRIIIRTVRIAVWLAVLGIWIASIRTKELRFTLSDLLDPILRNQGASFALLGVVLSISVLPLAKWATTSTRLLKNYEISGDLCYGVINPPVPAASIRFLSFNWTSLGILICLIVIGGLWVYGETRPISPTALLHFPDPTCHAGAPNLMIFVHGWHGDPQETWQQFPSLVCSDPDFENTEVLVLNYATFIAARNLTMQQTAEWIDEHFNDQSLAKEKIVIVAHSIGGLVSRNMLLQRINPLAPTGLLIEFATPHTGAESYTQLLNALGIPGGDIVSEVAHNSPVLVAIQDGWNSWPGHPRTICFWAPNDKVVSRESSIFQCDAYLGIPALDHRALVKPPDRKDDRYCLSMAYVKSYLNTSH